MPFNHSQKSLKPPEKYFERWYRYFLYRPRPVDHYTVKPGTRRWQGRCRGFYSRERRHAWTKGTAHIWGLPAHPGLPVELTIRTRGILPRALVCPVEIEVNGKRIYKETIKGGELDARKRIGPVRVSARINRGALDITIRSCEWRPSDLLGKGDRRKLGLDVRSIEIKTVRSRKPGTKRPSPR